MEISSIRGLPDLEIMEDPNFLHQWHLSSIDDLTLLPIAAPLGETLQHHSFFYPNFNPKTSMETALADIETPIKHLKSNSWISANKIGQTSEAQFVSYPYLPSFANSNYMNQGTLESGNENYVFKTCQDAKKVGARHKLSQPQDHIIAERKRREKLSQRFIALSALIPALQKTDKASILGGAIEYLKQLQEKVRALEEEQNKKTVESVVIVKKSQLSNDAEDSSTESDGPFDQALPEIEARFCERNVLIRVHWEKNKRVVEKTINEIEKLHLKVTNSSAMTFGSCALDITIIAQMDMQFSMTVKDFVRNLRSAFASFM